MDWVIVILLVIIMAALINIDRNLIIIGNRIYMAFISEGPEDENE